MTLPNTRPASWNFKMLSGEPLITDAQFEQLLANGLRQQPPMAAPDDLLPVLRSSCRISAGCWCALRQRASPARSPS